VPSPAADVDVLVVGAGPTGLALAAQVHRHGASVRVVDRNREQVHESRALAVQARTLEVLRGTGVTDRLVARGRQSVQLVLHGSGANARVPLFDAGVGDTQYPYILFVSQAETEAALADHLTAEGVAVERGVELVDLERPVGETVAARLAGPDATAASCRARYVVGCDGAHSTVRRLVGIPFRGKAYEQAFVLADLEVDGPVEPAAVHTWFGRRGLLFLFPLGSPATWRLIATRGSPGEERPDPVSLPALQGLVDEVTGGQLRLRAPVWLDDFRLACRQAAAYRDAAVFLAGDAAHVHSPAGGQGMNTGVQDAWNLGWKLALVARGSAPPELLGSYEAERIPVGRAVLRLTDRLFTLATDRRVTAVRTHVLPRLAPLVMRLPGRSRAFRRVAQLSLAYRRSPAVADGVRRGGLLAGDRLPDAPVRVGGRAVRLHGLVAAPGFHVLVTGGAVPPRLGDGPVTVHRLYGAPLPLAAAGPYVVVRPDGYVGQAGERRADAERYLARWCRR
jgi:2-polyprenyl-6-methoxyphenol hydroxylase-like FAD-dependent oxidoreductase